jgi:hypothetical protein
MPSSAPSLHVSQDPSRAHTPAPDANMSSKAAGKQPARERENKLDTQSEELFPALGGPKAAAPAAPSMWSRKPAAVGKAPNGSSNGLNIPLASNGSSRASTPASGIQTPGSAVPSQRGQPQMSLPGRQSEQIVLHPSMLKSRDQLKKPVSEVIREINKRSKAKVEMKNGPNGTLVFEGTGPTDLRRTKHHPAHPCVHPWQSCRKAGCDHPGHLQAHRCSHQHLSPGSC